LLPTERVHPRYAQVDCSSLTREDLTCRNRLCNMSWAKSSSKYQFFPNWEAERYPPCRSTDSSRQYSIIRIYVYLCGLPLCVSGELSITFSSADCSEFRGIIVYRYGGNVSHVARTDKKLIYSCRKSFKKHSVGHYSRCSYQLSKHLTPGLSFTFTECLSSLTRCSGSIRMLPPL
jgi:hypothetical protein